MKNICLHSSCNYMGNAMNAILNPTEHNVVIVTGLSGAGKTSVMGALEDLGFYCVDNLPLPLMSTFISLVLQSKINFLRVAIGIDVRGEQFLDNFMSAIKLLREERLCNPHIIFVNAQQQTLLKRFQETRRKHPLAGDISVKDAIACEKKLLDPILRISNMILDTDNKTIHELRRWIKNAFSGEEKQELVVQLVSFGFKHGVPTESNLVYDLRFLPNPYFIPALKIHDGTSQIIQEYLFNHSMVRDYWQRLTDFLQYSLTKFYEEGRFFVSVAVGCTGGRHRSVAFVEKLGKESWPHVKFLVGHRDKGKE